MAFLCYLLFVLITVLLFLLVRLQREGAKPNPWHLTQGLNLAWVLPWAAPAVMYFAGAEHQPEEFRFDLSLASIVFVAAVQGWQSQPIPHCLGMIASLAFAWLGILGSLQNYPARKNKHPRTGIRFILIADGSYIAYSNNFPLLNHSKCSNKDKTRPVSCRWIIRFLWASFCSIF